MRFRHELARNAIRSSLPIAARRRLHAEILEALLAADAEPADIVHHAEAAGAEDVVADYALVAARRAAALESNREAYSHYRRAADFVDAAAAAPSRRPCSRSYAVAAYIVGALDHALPAIERAIALYRELGDDGGRGPLHARRCRASTGTRATASAPAGRRARRSRSSSRWASRVELARAYSGLSQLAMLAEDADEAFAWGERALELAVRLGDDETRAHALVNIGTAQGAAWIRARRARCSRRTPSPTPRATGTRRRARCSTSSYTLMLWVRPEPALRYAEQGARLRRASTRCTRSRRTCAP